jgi:hypothetical protein
MKSFQTRLRAVSPSTLATVVGTTPDAIMRLGHGLPMPLHAATVQKIEQVLDDHESGKRPLPPPTPRTYTSLEEIQGILRPLGPKEAQRLLRVSAKKYDAIMRGDPVGVYALLAIKAAWLAKPTEQAPEPVEQPEPSAPAPDNSAKLTALREQLIEAVRTIDSLLSEQP